MGTYKVLRDTSSLAIQSSSGMGGNTNMAALSGALRQWQSLPVPIRWQGYFSQAWR
jgi:hypothetical protein